MAVAAAVDAMKWNEVVGCIPGDDTIMCAIRTVEDTAVVMENIRNVGFKESIGDIMLQNLYVKNLAD